MMRYTLVSAKQLLALCLIASFAASGCGDKGLSQDPFAGQSDKVKKGIPPEFYKPPEAPKPVSEEALRIDASDFYTFKEGQAGEITVGGRVLKSVYNRDAVMGQDFEITIENMRDFPGATYEIDKGVFKWTPPQQFVQGEYSRNAHLDLLLSTKVSPVMATRRSIQIFITRAETDPEVVDIEDLKTKPLREGEKREFKVVVKDPDSQDLDNRRPRIFAISNNNTNINANGLVYPLESLIYRQNPVQDPTDKTKWVFTMVLDARGRELTKGAEVASFSLIAVSRFGRSSAPKSADAMIWTSVQDPQISWSEAAEVYAGVENRVSFSVYDPQNEGTLSVNFKRCDILPGAPSCRCVEQLRDGALVCTLSWQPTLSSVGQDFWIEGEIINKSKIPGDTAYRRIPLRKQVHVFANPNPPPQPTPAPTPQPPPQPTPESTPITMPGPSMGGGA